MVVLFFDGLRFDRFNGIFRNFSGAFRCFNRGFPFGNFNLFLLLFLRCGGQRDEAVVVEDAHDLDALRGTGDELDFADRRPDDDAVGADHDEIVVIAFVIGTALTIWAVAKLIEMLLKKYEIQSYWGIIGFIVSSAIIIVLQNVFMVDGGWTSAATVLAGTSVLEYILGVLLAALGFYGAYKL